MKRTLSMRSIALGLAAGLIGGAVGSALKLVGEKVYPPRTQGQEPPPAVLAEKIAGHPLSDSQRAAASQGFHWTFGSLTGAAYGALAEVAPIVTVGYGGGFAVVLLLLTHESTLPLLGLDKPPTQQPAREHLSEFATHLLYGFGTEGTRRLLRRLAKTHLAC